METSLSARSFLSELGQWAIFLRQAFVGAYTRPWRLRDVAYHMVMLGNRSLLIATQVAVFSGMVLAVQFALFLSRLGLEYTVGRVVMVAVVRELGPVLTALCVGARMASGMTAELGAMRVTEQLDALRALGDEPIKRLVSPRLLASALVLPLLTAISDGLALVSAAGVVKLQYGLPFREFFSSAFDAATLTDFLSGIVKSFFFGILVAWVGCFGGFSTQAGSEGVGSATTQTVSRCAVGVLLADFILTQGLLAL
jgi:phospholipid/cholesterol/gamma-HCH transport system permease protein